MNPETKIQTLRAEISNTPGLDDAMIVTQALCSVVKHLLNKQDTSKNKL